LEAEPRPSRAPAFAWFTEASASARSSLLAASLGWMLDSYDVMLYSLVLPALMENLSRASPTSRPDAAVSPPCSDHNPRLANGMRWH